MAAIALYQPDIRALKSCLLTLLPDEKSSHLSEALARALHFNSHAALLAHVESRPVVDKSDTEVRLLDDVAFDQRMVELNPANSPGWWSHPMDGNTFDLIALDCPAVVQTWAPRVDQTIEFHSPRKKAWRTLMVSAINAGLQQGRFTLHALGNRWPGSTNDYVGCQPDRYEFELMPGLRAVVGVSDINCGELSLTVAVNPTPSCYARLARGSVFIGLDRRSAQALAQGWLERAQGAWLQYSPEAFICRRVLSQTLASVDVRPQGFGDGAVQIL